jgi:CubicO group peptidase (beta-lactamase class C family)
VPRSGMSRRAFGRLAGTAGLAGAAGAAGLAGSAGTAGAATKTWRTSGTAVAALAGFDSTMKTFMQGRSIPAGQLAVTYRGRLVLARGYAWTDDSTLTVRPTSLFRIASLSKMVTATAIMTLVQDGKLGLSTPVTSLLDLAPPAGQTADPRLSQITVRRLLQHLGGWDRDISGDPLGLDRTIAQALGKSLPITQDDIITWTSGRALDHDPGTTYAYSNYGYLLAGHLIEKVSGTSYPAYVQSKVLAPMGITRMQLGRSLAADRAATEVPYFSQYTGTTVLDGSGATVPSPYGSFNMANHESNGGWLSSAVDMVRFGTLFDGTKVLTSSSIASVFAQPEIGVNDDGWYYGLGWQVRPVTTGGTGRNTWHTGGLPGTFTIIVRTYHGMSWAALFDQRDDPSGTSYGDIDGALWSAAGTVTAWPTTDQFPTYF